MWHLKALTKDACLASVEGYFYPLAELFKGSFKSVFVFRRLRAASTAFLVKISLRYLGATRLMLLKTVIFAFLSINYSIVIRPKLWIRGLLGASKWLLVTMRAALFWSLGSFKMSVELQQPQTEQQYWKWGSTKLLYRFFTTTSGRKYLTYFRKPENSCHLIGQQLYWQSRCLYR